MRPRCLTKFWMNGNLRTVTGWFLPSFQFFEYQTQEVIFNNMRIEFFSFLFKNYNQGSFFSILYTLKENHIVINEWSPLFNKRQINLSSAKIISFSSFITQNYIFLIIPAECQGKMIISFLRDSFPISLLFYKFSIF